MKHLWAALKLLVILLLLVQCGPHRYPQQLSQLDALADSLPDEAVALMRKVDPQMKDASEWDRRYFQLLSIKVSDKADLPLPSDTVAWELVQYYEEEGDPQLLPMAYYYAARICRTRNDAPQALDYLLKANDLLADSHSHLKEVVNSQMGYLFSHQKLYRNAIEAFKRAYNCASINRDTTGMIFSLRDIGFNTDDPDSISMYLSKALQLAKEQKNKKFIANISAQLANLMCKEGKLENARSLIRVAIDNNDPHDQSAVNSIAAKIYDKYDNMEDSALYHYSKLLELNSVYAKERGYRGLFEHSFKRKALDSAFTYFQQYKLLSDSILNITATETVARMHASYNYQMREKENERLKKENEVKSQTINAIVVSVIIFILAAIISLLYIRHRDLTLKIRLERRQRVKAKIELAALLQKEQDNNLPPIEESDAVKSLHKILNDPKNKNKVITSDDWDCLEKTVENRFPGFKEQIVEICRLTDFKLHLCLLIKTKFSIADIALLTQHSAEAVTSARRRMAQKAFGQGCSPADWDKYILSL